MRDGDKEKMDESISAYDIGWIDGLLNGSGPPIFVRPCDTDAYNRGWHKGHADRHHEDTT